MTININSETIIPIRKVPEWCEENLGNRVSLSTVHRWRTRGSRGRALEWFKAGGVPYTSIEALGRFFDSGETTESLGQSAISKDCSDAVEFLKAELG